MRGLFSPNIQSTIRCDSFSSVASHDLSTLKHDFQHRLTLQFLEYRPVSWLGFIRHELIDSLGQCILTRIVRLACNSRVLTIHVFCQIEVVQNGVSIQSEKAAGFSPVERKDPPPLLFGFYPIRAWVRLYDSPSNLIILP